MAPQNCPGSPSEAGCLGAGSPAVIGRGLRSAWNETCFKFGPFRGASLRPFGRISGHDPGIQKSVSTEHLDRHPKHSTTTDLGIAKGTGHDRAEAPEGSETATPCRAQGR